MMQVLVQAEESFLGSICSQEDGKVIESGWNRQNMSLGGFRRFDYG